MKKIANKICIIKKLYLSLHQLNKTIRDMGLIIKHLGYYNNNEDMKHLAELSADDIMNYKQNGYGNFHISNDDDDRELDVLYFELTSDRKYLIVKDTPFDLNILNDENVCDFFIDIYEIMGGLEKSYDKEEFIDYGFTKKEMEFADYLIERINKDCEEDLLLHFDDFTPTAFAFFLDTIKETLCKDIYKHNFDDIVDKWCDLIAY